MARRLSSSINRGMVGTNSGIRSLAGTNPARRKKTDRDNPSSDLVREPTLEAATAGDFAKQNAKQPGAALDANEDVYYSAISNLESPRFPDYLEVATEGVAKNDMKTWRLSVSHLAELGADPKGHFAKEIDNIYITSVSESHRTRVTSHPIESGEHRDDSKVYQPQTYSARGYVKLDHGDDVRAALKEICYSGSSRSMGVYGYALDLYTPYGAMVGSLTLESFTMATDPDKYDLYPVSLNLKELMVSSAQTGKKTASEEHSSTVKK